MIAKPYKQTKTCSLHFARAKSNILESKLSSITCGKENVIFMMLGLKKLRYFC